MPLNRFAVSFVALAVLAVGGLSLLAPGSVGAQAPPSGYQALTPIRILDTRSGMGASGPVQAVASIDVKVTGVGGVPASGVGAVVLNVTATNATEATFVTVWPTGQPRPTASNLNVTAGQSVPNLVVATVGPDGKVSLFNYAGSVDLLADVAGWFPAGGSYHALTPDRVLDTRTGIGAPATTVAAGASIDLTVTGVGGVPASGVGAVVLNVTATNPSAATFVTVWPTGQTKPDASNLNVTAGQSVPNLVIAGVGADGKVSLYNYAGSVDLLADVAGWFPAGADYTGVVPSRILDTRTGVGAPAGPVAADKSIDVKVTGVGGVPASGVGAVVLNVTATNPTAPTFVTVWPTGQTKPDASNLNVIAGQSVPNLVIATVGAGGTVSLYNYAGTTDVIADVMGWFPGTTPPPPPPVGITGKLYTGFAGYFRSLDFSTRMETQLWYDTYGMSDYAVDAGGKELVFQDQETIYIRDLATTAFVHSFVSEGGTNWFDTFAPSPNRQLFAVLVTDLDSEPVLDHQLLIFDRTGKLLRSFGRVRDAAWAPDGRLAITAEPQPGTLAMGFLVDPSNSSDYQPIKTYSGFPFDDLPYEIEVSPTGSEIAYSYLGDLYVQPVDGSAARLIATSAAYNFYGTTFSPDGQYVAFVVGSSYGPYHVHIVPNHRGASIEVVPGGPTALTYLDPQYPGVDVNVVADQQLYWFA